MIERLLRLVFKAPTIHIVFEQDETLPQFCITLPELVRTIIGVEPGEEGWVGQQCVAIYDGDTPSASEHLIGLLGNGPLPVRRRIVPRLVRHLIGGAWTLAGMLIVLLTLSGAVQIISLVICVLFFLVDLMSISMRKP